MGILDTLFGNNEKIPTIPPNETVLPQKAIALINNNQLPDINSHSILLNHGEICRFVDKAYFVKEEITKVSRGNRNGVSFRIARGITYHTGGFNSRPVEEKHIRYIPGYLYITNDRLIFVSKNEGFEDKFSNITALIPYSNALGIQMRSKTLEFLLPRPDLAETVIHNMK